MILMFLRPLSLLICCASLTVNAADTPWRLGPSLGLPSNLSLTGQHRMRYETLDGQFRNGRAGGDQALMFRTSLLAEINFDRFKIGVEGLDSRAALADAGTPLGNTDVNPLDLLQAYIELPVADLFVNGSNSTLRGGRMTIDLGSRRLVARNSFRNTINAFTGVDWQWTGPGQDRFRAFYTLPVQRLVDGSPLDNDPEFDRQDTDVQLWGLYYAPARLPWGDPGEVYLLGLHEDDSTDLQTGNRDIETMGIRLYRQPAAGRFDYQLESIYQLGESRATAATSDVADLDHFAHFQHAEIGYTFASPWSPQLLLQYDYASGDDRGGDGDNNRFDTLFGARRFEYGPTSLWGAFGRANLSTPGMRLNLKPAEKLSAFVALRGFLLADSDDAWTTAGIRNPSGSGESFIGTQVEASLRWDIIPKSVQVELGGAYLSAGDLMTGANKGDSSYFYSQWVLSF
jgi:hypothetical protein